MLGDEITAWLTEHGFTSTHRDVSSVSVTPQLRMPRFCLEVFHNEADESLILQWVYSLEERLEVVGWEAFIKVTEVPSVSSVPDIIEALTELFGPKTCDLCGDQEATVYVRQASAWYHRRCLSTAYPESQR